MKLTKAELKQQKEIFDLINSDKRLTEDDKEFIYENINPGYIDNLSKGVYFTPIGLAQDCAVLSPSGENIVDVCAGIGILSYKQMMCDYYHCSIKNVYLIELNPEFLRIAKRLLTGMKNEKGEVYNIHFIQGNCFDENLWKDLTSKIPSNKFDLMVSNPPFGKCAKEDKPSWLKYNQELELMVAELCLRYAEYGYFILPSMSVPFQFSGQDYYNDSRTSNKFIKFKEKMNQHFHFSCDGIDCSIYKQDWKNLSGGIAVEAIRISTED